MNYMPRISEQDYPAPMICRPVSPVTAYSSIDNRDVYGMDEHMQAGFISGLHRSYSWRVPPNWVTTDWHDELRAVALAGAWQAKIDYDPSYAVPLDAFVFIRVQARTLTRYRQEWQYSLRFMQSDAYVMAQVAESDPAGHIAGAAFEALDRALCKLPEPERWLLEQLFWQRRTEADIACELHLSQPAVSKRKRLALVHLRTIL